MLLRRRRALSQHHKKGCKMWFSLKGTCQCLWPIWSLKLSYNRRWLLWEEASWGFPSESFLPDLIMKRLQAGLLQSESRLAIVWRWMRLMIGTLLDKMDHVFILSCKGICSIFSNCSLFLGMGESNCSWNRKALLHRDTMLAAAAVYRGELLTLSTCAHGGVCAVCCWLHSAVSFL